MQKRHEAPLAVVKQFYSDEEAEKHNWKSEVIDHSTQDVCRYKFYRSMQEPSVETTKENGKQGFGTGVANIYLEKPPMIAVSLDFAEPLVYCHALVITKVAKPASTHTKHVVVVNPDSMRTIHEFEIPVRDEIQVILPTALYEQLIAPTCAIKGYEEFQTFLKTTPPIALDEHQWLQYTKSAFILRVKYEDEGNWNHNRRTLNPSVKFWAGKKQEKGRNGKKITDYEISIRNIGKWWDKFKANKDVVNDSGPRVRFTNIALTMPHSNEPPLKFDHFVITGFFPADFLPQPKFPALDLHGNEVDT